MTYLLALAPEGCGARGVDSDFILNNSPTAGSTLGFKHTIEFKLNCTGKLNPAPAPGPGPMGEGEGEGEGKDTLTKYLNNGLPYKNKIFSRKKL